MNSDLFIHRECIYRICLFIYFYLFLEYILKNFLFIEFFLFYLLILFTVHSSLFIYIFTFIYRVHSVDFFSFI